MKYQLYILTRCLYRFAIARKTFVLKIDISNPKVTISSDISRAVVETSSICVGIDSMLVYER